MAVAPLLGIPMPKEELDVPVIMNDIRELTIPVMQEIMDDMLPKRKRDDGSTFMEVLVGDFQWQHITRESQVRDIIKEHLSDALASERCCGSPYQFTQVGLVRVALAAHMRKMAKGWRERDLLGLPELRKIT